VSDAVRLAQSGDQDAFARLYRENAGRVYALCLRLSGDAARAQDLTQDVFVRAWEKLPTFRGESAFSSWLHRLAVNVVLSGRRAEFRRESRVAPTDDLDGVGAASLDPPPGLAMDLERAIAALPPGARAVFVLHDIEGYEHREIAELTGIAAGTSKAHLFRARRLLREALQR
jgi:RNA polymerase sigma-70 factor (ECF subfamily)